MKTKKIIYLSVLALGVTISSCKKDVPDPETATAQLPNTLSVETYDDGVFITNEGPFNTGSGTVSFYHRTDANIDNEIFVGKNAYVLGNIVQSINVYSGTGYIVVNNADKIEVVDGSTLLSEGVITGLSSPRYFLGVNSTTGYVSQWGSGSGSVEVVDLNTKMITASIATGAGADNMVMAGNKVYVACSGGLGTDSVVTVINTTTNAVVSTINVGAGPKSIQVDASGDVWVLCAGKWDAAYTALEKTGSLVRIDASADTVNLSLPFSSTSSQPANLVVNSSLTTLYYTYDGKVFSHDVTATSLNTSATIDRSFYALGIDPTNDYFYGSDAVDFSSNGKVLRYNTTGTVLDSFSVGVIPGGFFFK